MTPLRMARSIRLASGCAAVALVLALSQGASAFSQIGTKDGGATQREGIVSVPLPPIAGATQPAPVEPQPPATPPIAPATSPTEPTAPAAPATGAPAATPEPATTPAAPPAADDPAPADADPQADDAPEGGVPPGAAVAPEEPSGPPPTIYHGEEALPQAVRDLRAKLIEIAKGGEIEALRPYLQVGEDGTLLSFGGADGDPIAYLKAASGDGEGVEILAILLEILEAGHVRNDGGTPDEIFVWPYFTAVAIDKLTKPQKVELFELVTAGDYQEMLGFGAYNFYRVGISPDGKLQFFVAGD